MAAIASADLARRGALALAAGEDETVFALCRPPGHHCAPDLMGGYCYLNNTAIAVQTLLDTLPADQQVSVLDLDFHHGNGTQQIFYRESNPCYVSIHGEDEYPYFSGARSEVGEGDGEGYNLNLPILCDEVNWDVYEPQLKEAVEKLKSVGTQWLVISLGFDTFVGDPVGKFQLQTENYGVMGETVGRCGWPLLVVLEGGYVIEELGKNCLEFLRGVERGRRMGKAPNGVNGNGMNGHGNGVNGVSEDEDEDEDEEEEEEEEEEEDEDLVMVNGVDAEEEEER